MQKTVYITLITLVLLLVLYVSASNYWVASYAQYTTADISILADQQVCLVLGTSPNASPGKANNYYIYRMQAAANLYHAHKCKVFIVSGDNRKVSYNEPELMRKSLLARGVPEDKIVADYGGRRTLDSVLRFQSVFNQQSGIVISQQFHNERAIYIARSHGVKLLGFNAKDVDKWFSLKTRFREIFSKSVVVLEVEVLDTKARHYGDVIALPE